MRRSENVAINTGGGVRSGEAVAKVPQIAGGIVTIESVPAVAAVTDIDAIDQLSARMLRPSALASSGEAGLACGDVARQIDLSSAPQGLSGALTPWRSGAVARLSAADPRSAMANTSEFRVSSGVSR